MYSPRPDPLGVKLVPRFANAAVGSPLFFNACSAIHAWYALAVARLSPMTVRGSAERHLGASHALAHDLFERSSCNHGAVLACAERYLTHLRSRLVRLLCCR